jgi:quercetin 2,3-dioxygenase
VEITPARQTSLGDVPIRRALPRRGRRTVGAWCFFDHLGPFGVSDSLGMKIGPHPHIGLHTVTWLLTGEVVHTDSLGTEQTIRPGQLNLMTAGAGVAHAEDSRTYRGPVHGAQLWVAQPEATRHGPPAFEQQRDLPVVDFGSVSVTLLCGAYGEAQAPTRTDTALVGVDLTARPGRVELPLDPRFEYVLVVLEGALSLAGSQALEPGFSGYLEPGPDHLGVECREPSRALLLGGEPFGETVSMWWNFVARTHDEIDAAAEDWQRGSDRFGAVASPLPRESAPGRPWALHRP